MVSLSLLNYDYLDQGVELGGFGGWWAWKDLGILFTGVGR